MIGNPEVLGDGIPGEKLGAHQLHTHPAEALMTTVPGSRAILEVGCSRQAITLISPEDECAGEAYYPYLTFPLITMIDAAGIS
jgi:hypothetical protein